MSNLLSFVGWTFLPDLITSNLQSFYYNLTIRAGDPKPQPGTPTFAKHRQRIYIAVIIAYLCYTLYEADWQVRRDGDFYTDLGVAYDADDKAIQSRFRKLTLLHHPDKLPTNTSPATLATAQDHYIYLTTARDTLLSVPKRHAYDRLGPIVTKPTWHPLKTTHDLILAGLKSLVPFYTASALGLWIADYFQLLGTGGDTYWRYLALAVMGVTEVHALTRPWHTAITMVPAVLNPWINALATLPGLGWVAEWARTPYLPFQAVIVAHRALIAFFVALSRLGPVLGAMMGGAGPQGNGEEALARQLGGLEQRVGLASVEAARLLALEAVPFRTTVGPRTGVRIEGPGAMGGTVVERDQGLEKLRHRVKEWFVTNTIRQDPEVRKAVEKVIERRKAGEHDDGAE